MGRAPCCEKVGLKRGRWTAEEDEILANYIAKHGEGSWRSLPKNAGLLRCGKSCRLRWINYLREDVKRGNISKEEENVIIKLHATLGNRWSLIASHLPGRTDNEIKNYWNSHLSRQIHTYRRTYTAGPDTTITIDISKLHSAEKRRGGRTPGWSPKTMTTTAATLSTNKQAKSKQPGPDKPESESGRAKSASAASAASSPRHSAVVDPDQNQPDSSGEDAGGGNNAPEGTCSEDATGPLALEPMDEFGGLWEAESEMEALLSSDSIGAGHDNNAPEGTCSEDATGPLALEPMDEFGGLWEAESEMEALLSSDGIGAGHELLTGFDPVGEAQVDDLLDMDWDGFAAHLWGEPTAHLWGEPTAHLWGEPVAQQNDDQSTFLQPDEPQAAAAGCSPPEDELESFETWLLSDSF